MIADMSAVVAGVLLLSVPATPTVLAPTARVGIDWVRWWRACRAARPEEARADEHFAHILAEINEWEQPARQYEEAARVHLIAGRERAERRRRMWL